MAIYSLIMGKSGTGKSTSLRNLNPAETFIINILDKPLPFRGSKSKYKLFSKDNPQGNYFTSDKAADVCWMISYINTKRPDIKVLIIDDWQYIMCNEFMRRAPEKGFGKFAEIGMNAWSVIDTLKTCRDDLISFLTAHTQTEEGETSIKTTGKMLDTQTSLDGYFTCIFHSKVVDGTYKFLTQHDGAHVARSPMGLFEGMMVDNDLLMIKDRLIQYFTEEGE